jgi:dihydrofolate reductase
MINIIVAYCKNRGIGINNRLPWYLHQDLKRFKLLTTGDDNSIIMGRKTWESLPVKPLPKRKNIIVSRTMKDTILENTVVKRSLTDALNYSNQLNIKNTWIIGGSSIYREALCENLVDNIYATEIDASLYCDVYFPDIPENFVNITNSKWYTQNFLDYQYVHYRNENTVEKKKFIETKSSGDSKIYKELFLGKHDYEEGIVNF